MIGGQPRTVQKPPPPPPNNLLPVLRWKVNDSLTLCNIPLRARWELFRLGANFWFHVCVLMAHQGSRRDCFTCWLFPRLEKGRKFPSRAAARDTLSFSLSLAHTHSPRVESNIIAVDSACFTCVNLFQLLLGGAAAFKFSDSYLCVM